MLRQTSPFRSACAILLAVLLVGGHVACVQLVAWGTMFADRWQRTGDAAVALGSTFDGSAPCSMCRAASALGDADGHGKTAPTTEKSSKKADFSAIPVTEAIFPSSLARMTCPAGERHFRCGDPLPVETPPPQG